MAHPLSRELTNWAQLIFPEDQHGHQLLHEAASALDAYHEARCPQALVARLDELMARDLPDGLPEEVQAALKDMAALVSDVLRFAASHEAESPDHEKTVRKDLLVLAKDLRDNEDDLSAGVLEVAEAHIGMLRRLLTDARAAMPDGCELVECQQCEGKGKIPREFMSWQGPIECPDCLGTGKRLRKKEA